MSYGGGPKKHLTRSNLRCQVFLQVSIESDPEYYTEGTLSDTGSDNDIMRGKQRLSLMKLSR